MRAPKEIETHQGGRAAMAPTDARCYTTHRTCRRDALVESGGFDERSRRTSSANVVLRSVHGVDWAHDARTSAGGARLRLMITAAAVGAAAAGYLGGCGAAAAGYLGGSGAGRGGLTRRQAAAHRGLPLRRVRPGTASATRATWPALQLAGPTDPSRD
jgi:hypothetical protein